jgi:hypothetical protein
MPLACYNWSAIIGTNIKLHRSVQWLPLKVSNVLWGHIVFIRPTTLQYIVNWKSHALHRHVCSWPIENIDFPMNQFWRSILPSFVDLPKCIQNTTYVSLLNHSRRVIIQIARNSSFLTQTEIAVDKEPFFLHSVYIMWDD